MATGSCVFVVVLADSALLSGVRARAEALRDFYAPVAALDVALACPTPRIVVGVIGPETQQLRDDEGIVSWGEPLPSPLARGRALCEADDASLRAIAGMTAACGWSNGRALVLCGASGPATLYTAAADGVTAYATHAVAASVLAGTRPSVDADAIPEFIAFDFVGGDRTLVHGATVVAPASAIEIDGAGVQSRDYWPAVERWRPLPEATAYEATRSALLASLRERAGDRRLGIALTAGLDSTAGAAAIAELELDAFAFTWGDPSWPDCVGAALTAQTLGIEHRLLGAHMLTADEALAALDRAARWADGVGSLSLTERDWPSDCGALVIGMGGETGRAFYYDGWVALLERRPSPLRLARQLGAATRLHGAREDACTRAERSTREWVEAAIAAGAQGWDALDVVYTEQRVRRWGRAQVPPLPHDFLPLFTAPEVARGLFSHPRRDRLGDGFQGRFVRASGLLPEREPAAVPDPSQLGLVLRRLRGSLRRSDGGAPSDYVDPFIPHVWRQVPTATAFVHDEVLTHPLIVDTLGADWALTTADGFTEGLARTTERALRATGVVALDRALMSLRM